MLDPNSAAAVAMFQLGPQTGESIAVNMWLCSDSSAEHLATTRS